MTSDQFVAENCHEFLSFSKQTPNPTENCSVLRCCSVLLALRTESNLSVTTQHLFQQNITLMWNRSIAQLTDRCKSSRQVLSCVSVRFCALWMLIHSSSFPSYNYEHTCDDILRYVDDVRRKAELGRVVVLVLWKEGAF